MRKKTNVVWKGYMRQNQAMTARRHRVVCVLADGMTSIGPAIANDLVGAPWDLGVPWYSYRVCTADPVPSGSARCGSRSNTASAPCPGPTR